MKHEIETYKGQTIFYNEESDKFECDISTEDKYKSTKRQSLLDVKKEVDTFLKLNLDFKPFECLELDQYRGDSFSEKYVHGIRTDGLFIVSQKVDSSSKSHYKKKDMERLMIYDAELVKEKQILEQKFEQARIEYKDALANLCKRLRSCDLSRYDNVLNKENTL